MRRENTAWSAPPNYYAEKEGFWEVRGSDGDGEGDEYILSWVLARRGKMGSRMISQLR